MMDCQRAAWAPRLLWVRRLLVHHVDCCLPFSTATAATATIYQPHFPLPLQVKEAFNGQLHVLGMSTLFITYPVWCHHNSLCGDGLCRATARVAVSMW